MFFPLIDHLGAASPTHGTEFTSGHVVQEEQPVIPDSSVAATTNVTWASTSDALEDLVTPPMTPASLLEHVSISYL